MFSTIPCLVFILGLLTFMVAGKGSILPLLSMLLNFLVLFICVRLYSMGFSIIPITVVSTVIILAITILMSSSDSETGTIAFYTAMLVVMMLFIIIWFLLPHLNIQGFGNENTDDLEGMSLLIGVKFYDLMFATVLFSSLGAISEASIAIASGVIEIKRNIPDVSLDALIKNGLNIGKEIAGATLNTVFFGFFGSFLGLFIWITQLHYSWMNMVNNKIFVAGLSMVLLSIIGVLLTIPGTLLVIKLKEKFTF